MKRILAAILFLLYFTSSSGATFHLHFCMDELMGMSLSENREIGDTCNFCGMEMPVSHESGLKTKDCCKDKKVEIKTDKDQRLTLQFDTSKSPFSEVICFLHIKYHVDFFPDTVKVPDDDVSPGGNKIPVFLRNGVFRI